MYMPSTDGHCEFSLFVQMAIAIYRKKPLQVINIQKCKSLESQNLILATWDSILTSQSSFKIRQSSAILKSRPSTFFWAVLYVVRQPEFKTAA